MNVDKAKEVFAEFKRLTKEDRDVILHGLQRYFGKKTGFSLDKLSEMDYKDLEIIKSTINGMLLTREYVPDVRTAYERDKDIPSEISFGCLDESAIKKESYKEDEFTKRKSGIYSAGAT